METETEIGLGNPAMKLTEMAKDGYEMVVVSRKGLGATKSLFIGSVSVGSPSIPKFRCWPCRDRPWPGLGVDRDPPCPTDRGL